MLTVCLPSSQKLLKEFLSHLQFVEKIITVGEQEDSSTGEFVEGRSLFDGSTLQQCIERTTTPYLLLVLSQDQISTSAHALTRMLDVASDIRAGIVYGDYHDVIGSNWIEHPCNDYQDGSVRDTFDFGPFTLVRMEAAHGALRKYGAIPPTRWAGFYDLRLKISIDHAIFHLQEFLSSKTKRENRTSGERQFDYVDPSNSAVQKEMEEIFTDHLKRIGAYLPPVFQEPLRTDEQFPVKASVVIPVRNRKNVIADALESVVSQIPTFPFNCLVVDNHSTDGTGEVIERFAEKSPIVHHIIPERTNLGIGGCWNEAIFSPLCGAFAVQLDSDDLYASPNTLQRIVDELELGYAMVIGAYTVVNKNLQPIPPGIVNHNEWTPENGRNNALRINGLGAPRAFRTSCLRQIGGFPNVSYGEDYAVALRISRQYQIGRIFDSLYLCRRWEGNSDAALPIELENKHNAYKDQLRTIELAARKEVIRQQFDDKKSNKAENALH